MKNENEMRRKLLLEYTKLATGKIRGKNGEVKKRMDEILATLSMNHEKILEEAEDLLIP